jgi:hypothetical protein
METQLLSNGAADEPQAVGLTVYSPDRSFQSLRSFAKVEMLNIVLLCSRRSRVWCNWGCAAPFFSKSTCFI